MPEDTAPGLVRTSWAPSRCGIFSSALMAAGRALPRDREEASAETLPCAGPINTRRGASLQTAHPSALLKHLFNYSTAGDKDGSSSAETPRTLACLSWLSPSLRRPWILRPEVGRLSAAAQGCCQCGGPDPESVRETPSWCSSKGLGPSHVQLGVITVVPRELGVTFWLL